MLALILVPARIWGIAETGESYRGFDPHLVYPVEKTFSATTAGVIDITDSDLTLVAPAGSTPLAHLVTTPMGFDADMDITVNETSDGRPFRIGVWSVRTQAGYYLNFGPPPFNVVTSTYEVGDQMIAQNILGTYSPGQKYHVRLNVDRERQELTSWISVLETLPVEGNALLLKGGPQDPTYGDAFSNFVPVEPGQTYNYGGWVRPIIGTDAYKISVFWYDSSDKLISFSNDWHSIRPLKDWTEVSFEAQAPFDAVKARIFLGSGNGTSNLFTGVFMRAAGSTQSILPNASFTDGTTGWNSPADKRAGTVISSSPLVSSNTLTAADAPDLFGSMRLSLTAFSESTQGQSSATLSSYQLTLPPDLYQTMKTENGGLPVLILLAAGLILCAVQLASAWRQRAGQQASQANGPVAVLVHLDRRLVLALAALAAYFIGNGVLFHLGQHPFDMLSQNVWAYIGTHVGLVDVYPLANTVTLARAWNGSPYHEAIFPYIGLLAYYFSGIGWMSRIFFDSPGPWSPDAFTLEFMIKTGNVLFGLADAVLIVLILRQLKVANRSVHIAGALFVFNPALWLDMSIWGGTESISIFFILLSVWRAERGSPQMAWLALGGAVLTRPQMAIPAALLAIVYLRKFGLSETLKSASWTVIAGFFVLAPFLYHFSPSFPVDYFRLVARTHVEHGGETIGGVASGSYSIWPLVTGFTENVSGLDRGTVPQSTHLIGNITYGGAGNLLVFGLLLSIIGALALRKRAASAEVYLPLLALAMFGWSMFTTQMISRYFLYALAFVIVSRASLRGFAYYSVVSVLTVTITVATWASLGLSIEDVPQLASGFHPDNNVLTRWIMDLYGSDWFITAGVIANMAVLLWLSIVAFRPSLPARRARQRPELEQAADGWPIAQPQDI